MKLYSILLSAFAGAASAGVAAVSSSRSDAAAVEGAPVITRQPESAVVFEGFSFTFGVEAEGAEPLSYRWHKGAFEFMDDTNSVFSTGPVNCYDAGNYFCVVSNALGVTTSETAVLIINTNGYFEITAAL